MRYSVIEQDSFYRRGLVLGLTMAEIAVLIIFILLLAFGAHLVSREERIRALTVEVQTKDAVVEAKNAEIAALRDEAAKLTDELTRLKAMLGAPDNFDDLFRELTLEKEKAARVPDLERQVAALSERTKTLDQIESALKQSGLSGVASDQAVAQLLAQRQAMEELKKVLTASGGDPKAIQEFIDDRFRKLKEAEAQIATLEGQRLSLQNKLDALGRGTEMPACWASRETGRPDYIFNATLTSTGIVLHDNALPQRADEQKQLPIATIRFDTERSLSESLTEKGVE